MSTSGVSEDFRDEDMGERYPLHDCCEFEDAESLRVRVVSSFAAVAAPLDDFRLVNVTLDLSHSRVSLFGSSP